MSNLRPFSQASSSRSSNKPAFQRKTKPRIKGLSGVQDNFNFSTDLGKSTEEGFYSSRSQRMIGDNKQQQDSKFYQTASKLSQVNFSNHCSQNCICNQCSCGRHLCKFNNIKPDLTKNTIYKKDFLKKQFSPVKVIVAKQYDRLDGPHLEMNSTQRVSFKQRAGDKIQRPIPQDLLKSKGPAPVLTTYRSLFPGYKGDNQYVKPTDKHFREKFPLRSKSTYSDNFVNKAMRKDDYKYFNDQLKTGGNWYGKSTYGNFYQNPNPEYQAKKVKIIEKLQINPGFNHQYETTYKNDFIEKGVAVCGAKIHMQTKGRGVYSNTKDNFGENTDFKAMSPTYKAFSVSRFSFV